MRFTSLLVGALLAILAGAAFDTRAATPDFVADAAVQKAAEASAADAVAMAKRQFNIVLNGSDNSIDDVERALAAVHSVYAVASPKPSDDDLLPMAKAFGAYLGEVYRKNHGATWGIVSMNGQRTRGFGRRRASTCGRWGG